MSKALQRMVQSMIEPVRRRVMMTVGRAVLRAVDDSGSRQTAQIEALKGEVRDLVERMQNYGFTSVPLPGADAAVVFVAGNREQGIIVAVDDRRYRLTGLEGGEVAIYDDQGQKVHLTRTGIVIDGGSVGPITFQNATKAVFNVPVEIAQALTMTGAGAAGNITTGGTITATTDVVGGGKSLKTHIHSGVIPGVGNSGAPV